ncbi:MAG: endonuclease/exonuclease/phosphatase family protein, partial [Pseudonocardia sediminis]
MPPPRPSRLRSGIRGTVLVAAAVLLLLPDLLGLDGRLPFVLLIALRPLFTAVVAVLAGVGVVRSLRRGHGLVARVAVLAVAVVSAAVLAPRVFGDGDAPVPAGSRPLTLLSFNVYDGAADVPTLAALVRERRPDVVVLPEAAERYRGLITGAVPEMGYRSWVAAAPGAPDIEGVVVLASPGLGDLRARTVTGSLDPWLEITGGALGPVRLLGVHTAAPTPDKIASWPRELASLARWCSSGGPAIVAGDFNATLDHAAFRDGTRGCRDTGAATGSGLVGTWDARTPRVTGAQIDHVLTAGGPTARDLEIVDVPGSDHRALL